MLTPAEVRNAKPGRHLDGGGLYLLVKPTGGKSWLLRVQVEGKRRDIGLGTADTSSRAESKAAPFPIDIPLLRRKMLTLADAREKARILRAAAKAGLDPSAERDRERRAIPTFRLAARAAHEALQSGWKTKGAHTFISSLENHAYPVLGDKRVDAITAADITEALAPIWTTKPDMARKVRQRIGKVLNFAHGQGWRASESPTRSVTVGLPRQPKGSNYRAMPYADVPAFIASMAEKVQTVGRQALLFQILTAARPGEVRAATWGQIDLAKRDWNRPATIMKAGEAHTVTLSSPAVRLLEQVKDDRKPKAADLIFPGQRGAMMSDMTMAKVLRSAERPFDAHGFRSSFRDWVAEKTDVVDPVAEAALAHIVPDKVVRAYKRTDFIDRRRELLESWGAFVAGAAQ
jgi:integrase